MHLPAVDPTARPSERFGRARRVRTRAEFARVRARGRAVSGALLTLTSARGPEGAAAGPAGRVQPAAAARVGFTVGRRVGGAVVRNRVRRRLRELTRRRLGGVAPGWDLVIAARAPAATATSAALGAELDRLLARAKVLAAGSEEGGV